jgi:hypothetical protein
MLGLNRRTQRRHGTCLQRSDAETNHVVKAPSAVRSVGFDPQDTKIAIGTDTGMVQIHAVKIQYKVAPR